MNILLIHNHYQQPGGEDVVFASKGALQRPFHPAPGSSHCASGDTIRWRHLRFVAPCCIFTYAGVSILGILMRNDRDMLVFTTTTLYFRASNNGITSEELSLSSSADFAFLALVWLPGRPSARATMFTVSGIG